MERNRPRRKACDICYTKKLKCDGQRPRCSNCAVYGSDCTFVASTRKTTSKKQQLGEIEENLRSRVTRLESRLEETIEKLTRLEGAGTGGQSEPESSASRGHVPVDTQQRNLFRVDMALPPSQDVLPIVMNFLSTFNSLIPLFNGSMLLRTVLDWYLYPLRRKPTVWAAINVVLALACCQDDTATPLFSMDIKDYLGNAQSLLAELVMGDIELINVQVLAGLVLLYQGMPNPAPSTVLLAAALRLAHRLCLNSRRSSEHLDASEALQRSRVFWIIYILDRDISLRMRNPPLQADAEIDLDLPPEEPDTDDVGFVFTADNQSKVNFFRAQVQLAQIQGQVYDSVYSVWAQNASREERAERVTRILDMLNNWTSKIPPSFTTSSMALSDRPELLRFFCILHGTRLSCLGLVLRANYMDEQWVTNLREYGKKAAAGELQAPSTSFLPHGWQTLVDESRDFLWLFTCLPKKDMSLIWTTLCAYTCGLVCLVANNMCNQHQSLEFDKQLVEIAMRHVDEMGRQTRNENFQSVWHTCIELIRYAHAVTKRKEGAESSVVSWNPY